jgi:hypothetical protein
VLEPEYISFQSISACCLSKRNSCLANEPYSCTRIDMASGLARGAGWRS